MGMVKIGRWRHQTARIRWGELIGSLKLVSSGDAVSSCEVPFKQVPRP